MNTSLADFHHREEVSQAIARCHFAANALVECTVDLVIFFTEFNT